MDFEIPILLQSLWIFETEIDLFDTIMYPMGHIEFHQPTICHRSIASDMIHMKPPESLERECDVEEMIRDLKCKKKKTYEIEKRDLKRLSKRMFMK